MRLCRCSAHLGCVGFEYEPHKDEYRLAFKEEHQGMFDLFFDAGFEILGEDPLKANEAEYPYRRYRGRWKDFDGQSVRQLTTKPQRPPSG